MSTASSLIWKFWFQQFQSLRITTNLHETSNTFISANNVVTLPYNKSASAMSNDK